MQPREHLELLCHIGGMESCMAFNSHNKIIFHLCLRQMLGRDNNDSSLAVAHGGMVIAKYSRPDMIVNYALTTAVLFPYLQTGGLLQRFRCQNTSRCET